MNKRLIAAWLGGLVAVGATGCDLNNGTGELSNGDFNYACEAGSDAICDSPGEFSVVPEQIAVGSEFGLTYDGETPEDQDGVRFQVTVQPASSVFIETIDRETFRAVAAGRVAMMARGANGVVADLFHINLEPIAQLNLEQDGLEIGDLELSATRPTAIVEVVPTNANDRVLAGALAYSWESSDEDVAIVRSVVADNAAEIEAVGAGQATLTVRQGEIETTVDVTVEGAQQ